MQTKWLSVACVLVVSLSSVGRANFTVDSWGLGAGCSNTGGLTSDFYSQVQDPFNPPPLVVTRHNSMATAAYAFNWGLATGQFNIDADLASEGGDGLPFCGTDNQVNFHITQDTLLSINGELSYQFNGGIRSTRIRFTVRNLDTNSLVLNRSDFADTVAGDPPTDTLHVTDSIVLQAGNYSVRALMSLDAVGGSPNSISTAHGFANIQMNTVPCPAALAPLAFAALLIRRRRPRQ